MTNREKRGIMVNKDEGGVIDQAIVMIKWVKLISIKLVDWTEQDRADGAEDAVLMKLMDWRERMQWMEEDKADDDVQD